MEIYKITNLINNKFYIGLDTLDRKNYYGSGTAIKSAIKKYGKENFQKEILEKCDSIDKLNEREIYWIKELNSKYSNGYNLTDGGRGSKGFKVSEETKKKISKNLRGKNKGKKLSPEHYKIAVNNFINISEESKRKRLEKLKGNKNRRGKKCSLESRKRMSESHIGHIVSQKTKEKISKKMKGRKLSQETKNKMGLSKRGEKHPFWNKHLSKETKKKLSLAHKGQVPWTKGIKLTSEHKNNISKALKGKKKKPFTDTHRKKLSDARMKYLRSFHD